MRTIDADALITSVAWHDQQGTISTIDDILDIIDAFPTLTPPNKWVSVEERLPEEKQRVIVRCERVGTSVGWILWGRWMTDIGPDAGEVTHWMPLPAPPDRRPPERQEDTDA